MGAFLGASDGKMDVFILLHRKDMPILPHCMDSVSKYVRPKVDKITIIPDSLSPELAKVLETRDALFLEESRVFDRFTREDIGPLVIHGKDRSGWYFQQFLKWEISKFTYKASYLVVDADTIFVRPVEFIKNNKYILYRSKQYHLPYFETYERLFGYLPKRQKSFIVNFMVFDKKIVNEIKSKIERKFNKKWYEAILDSIERTVVSSFSEYETYGYFLSQFYPNIFESRANLNLSLTLDSLYGKYLLKYLPITKFLARLRFNSVSFHNYGPMR